MDEKENIEVKFLICKSVDLLLARLSQRLRRAGAGLKRNPQWDKIIESLSPLASKDGL